MVSLSRRYLHLIVAADGKRLRKVSESKACPGGSATAAKIRGQAGELTLL